MFGKKAETEVVEEVEHELKFKEWFNLKGIRAEIKNIHWLTKKELFNNSFKSSSFNVCLIPIIQ